MWLRHRRQPCDHNAKLARGSCLLTRRPLRHRMSTSITCIDSAPSLSEATRHIRLRLGRELSSTFAHIIAIDQVNVGAEDANVSSATAAGEFPVKRNAQGA